MRESPAGDAGQIERLNRQNGCSRRELTAICDFRADFGANPPISALSPGYGLLHSGAVFGIALPVASEHSLASRMRV
jgi:hypothetical protein